MPQQSDPTLDDVIEAWIRGSLADVRTSALAKVTAVDTAASPPTASVRLAVKRQRLDEDDALEVFEGPILPDLPVLYTVMGSASIHADLEVGDEVFVVWLESDHDNAIATGNDISDPATPRRHHLMDGVVIPRAWSASVPADAREANALVIEHGTKIKLGKSATQRAVLVDDLVTRMNAIESAFNAHTHLYDRPSSGSTTPTATGAGPSAGTTAAADIQASKVFLE